MENEENSTHLSKDDFLILFQEKLNDYLDNYDITRKELQITLGIPESTLRNYLNGDRMPDLYFFYRLRFHYDFKMMVMLGLSKPESENPKEKENKKLSSKEVKDRIIQKISKMSMADRRLLLDLLEKF